MHLLHCVVSDQLGHGEHEAPATAQQHVTQHVLEACIKILPRLQHLPVTQPACCQSNVAGTTQWEGRLLGCVVLCSVVLCVYRASVSEANPRFKFIHCLLLLT